MTEHLASEDLATLAGLTLVFLFAGCVKGVIGMGLPTVALGAALALYAITGLAPLRI